MEREEVPSQVFNFIVFNIYNKYTFYSIKPCTYLYKFKWKIMHRTSSPDSELRGWIQDIHIDNIDTKYEKAIK